MAPSRPQPEMTPEKAGTDEKPPQGRDGKRRGVRTASLRDSHDDDSVTTRWGTRQTNGIQDEPASVRVGETACITSPPGTPSDGGGGCIHVKTCRQGYHHSRMNGGMNAGFRLPFHGKRRVVHGGTRH